MSELILQVVKNINFHETATECRDVTMKKVLKHGWDPRTTHYTHVVPMTPYIVVILLQHKLERKANYVMYCNVMSSPL